MAEPNRVTEQPTQSRQQQPITEKQALEAVKNSASRHMAQVDYLPSYVEGLLKNAQLMTAIFNEKTKRQAAAEEAAGIPPEKRSLPDLAELKMVMDANAEAVRADIALRDEHRKAMQWSTVMGPRQKAPSSVEFGQTAKAPKAPAPAND
jgi:hypothetical protein